MLLLICSLFLLGEKSLPEQRISITGLVLGSEQGAKTSRPMSDLVIFLIHEEFGRSSASVTDGYGAFLQNGVPLYLDKPTNFFIEVIRDKKVVHRSSFTIPYTFKDSSFVIPSIHLEESRSNYQMQSSKTEQVILSESIPIPNLMDDTALFMEPVNRFLPQVSYTVSIPDYETRITNILQEFNNLNKDQRQLLLNNIKREVKSIK